MTDAAFPPFGRWTLATVPPPADERSLTWFEGAMQSPLIVSGITIAVAAAVALAIHLVLFAILSRLSRIVGSVGAKATVRRAKAPTSLLLPLAAIMIVLPGLEMDEGLRTVVGQILSVGVIVAVTWLLVSLTRVANDVVAERFPMDVPDNRRARRMHTIVRIMRQTAVVIIIVVGGAVALMTFPQVRQLGTSMLASAGIVGIAVGMAARPALSNIIAGMQIAITEPIMIDDVVIVEGEFGRVEEITTTYVVVRIWDLRRIIVPLSHFIEKPFQNWTRNDPSLLGTVFVHTDFTVPVQEVREQLTRILESQPKWNQQVNVVHVTDAINDRLELRLLMSASSAPELWDLRCAVREAIVSWLQDKHPEALERTRVEITGFPIETNNGHAAPAALEAARAGARGPVERPHNS